MDLIIVSMKRREYNIDERVDGQKWREKIEDSFALACNATEFNLSLTHNSCW